MKLLLTLLIFVTCLRLNAMKDIEKLQSLWRNYSGINSNHDFNECTKELKPLQETYEKFMQAGYTPPELAAHLKQNNAALMEECVKKKAFFTNEKEQTEKRISGLITSHAFCFKYIPVLVHSKKGTEEVNINHIIFKELLWAQHLETVKQTNLLTSAEK